LGEKDPLGNTHFPLGDNNVGVLAHIYIKNGNWLLKLRREMKRRGGDTRREEKLSL